MPNSPLSGLDVHATDVAAVEHNVLAEAQENALRLEAEEQTQLLSALDNQLIQLRKQERILASARFSTAGNRQLQALRTRIHNVQNKRAKLIEAAEARRQIRDSLPEQTKEAHIGEGESERDFLVRTGKVTPFAGQRGYERRQAAPVRRVAPTDASTVDKQFQSEENRAGPARVAKRQRTTTNKIYGSSTAGTDRLSNASGEKVQSTQFNRREADIVDDDYVPEQSGGEDDDEEDWELDESSANQKRKRRSISVMNFDEDADEEIFQESHQKDLSNEFPVEEREGSEWEPEIDEEVEFDGGLRIPSSVYDRLFDYQKTGVSVSLSPFFYHPFCPV